mmetsp:Transcript_99872/g.160991  ORF Transcript_99872/g.160991 Transcript_99872/m.160991 type:complete len:227 (-) Transcript_99872:2576-3256(-)
MNPAIVLLELALLARLIFGARRLVKEVVDVLVIDLHVRYPYIQVLTGLLGVDGQRFKESRERARQDTSTLVLAAFNGEGFARVCRTIGKYEPILAFNEALDKWFCSGLVQIFLCCGGPEDFRKGVLVLLAEVDLVIYSEGLTLVIASRGYRCTHSNSTLTHHSHSSGTGIILFQRLHAQNNIDVHGSAGSGTSGPWRLCVRVCVFGIRFFGILYRIFGEIAPFIHL